VEPYFAEVVMAAFRHIQVSQISGSAGEVSRVSFAHRRIIDDAILDGVGQELFGLVERDGARTFVLNFASVDYLGSAGLNFLVMLRRRVQSAGGKLCLCGLNPILQQAFTATKLTKLFEIRPDEREFLQGL
jgi:anti-sigma B factor antagonist